jgi:cytochrome c peroxidase
MTSEPPCRDQVTPDGRLPDADKGGPKATAVHLREVFGRMGFDDRELVALSGAHTIGFCRPETSGYSGKWTPSPTRFNNMYYRILLNMRWARHRYIDMHQYIDTSTHQYIDTSTNQP